MTKEVVIIRTSNFSMKTLDEIFKTFHTSVKRIKITDQFIIFYLSL